MEIVKKAVITGPTGAIGMALIDELIGQGMTVLAICHKGSRRIGRLQKFDSQKVKILELDLQDYEKYQPAEKETDYDVFYHLAWNGTFGDSRMDMDLQQKNIKYALDACELAKRFGCTCFLGAGSQAEYGRVEGVINEETPAFPENGYGIAKLAAGQMTRIRCRQLGIRHIWARFFSVYGPYDGENTMVMSTIRKLKNGEVPKFTPAEQMWDYLYSGDAARMLYELVQKGIDGEIYCLASGQTRPLKEFIKEIRDVVSPGAELAIGALPYGTNQVMNLNVDVKKIKLLGIKKTETLFIEKIKELSNN